MNGSQTLNLLFLPGIDGTGISFEPLRPFIRANIETTVIKYPADEPLTFEETVDCASRQVRMDFDVALAESFSGPVAVALIGLGRLKVKGLMLCATFARAPRTVLMKAVPLLPVESVLNFRFPDSWLRYFIRNAKAAGVILPLWHQIRTVVPANILAHRIRTVGRIDVRNYLSSLTMPCLYIQAAQDRIVTPSAALDFAAGVRGLQIRRIEGPHPILQVEPEASAAVINDFIATVTGLKGT